jgi:hypothetical protein
MLLAVIYPDGLDTKKYPLSVPTKIPERKP